MTDLALLGSWILIVAFGFVAPFVWTLGYIWVDVFTPHQLSYSLLSSVPMALIMGAGSLFSYLLADRRYVPRVTLEQGLILILAMWITLTETWAIFPVQAWTKWDPSFKVLVFSFFIPFVFRSRVQIEAFVLVLILSSAGHILPWGVKTFITGGGYEQSLGLLGSNASLLSESSSVAAVAVMFVPLILWIKSHSLIVPRGKLFTGIILAIIVIYLVATIGTFARTGLVGLGLLGFVLLIRSKRKFLFIISLIFVGGILLSVTSDKWTQRMETLSDVKGESSAYARILVWKWTIDYVIEHPMGGGFDSYLAGAFQMPPGPDGVSQVVRGRAFHSIYFATLGQHGFPGLALYLSIMFLIVLRMQKIARLVKKRVELAWAYDLARASQLALIILMACGSFIDISFNFIIWDVIALQICLNSHVRQALKTGTTLPALAPLSALARPRPVVPG